jgi:hypothetical protein
MTEFFLHNSISEVRVTFSRFGALLLLALALTAGHVRPAAAQTDVTTGDVQRLQDSIY